jgi:hypothetical protein
MNHKSALLSSLALVTALAFGNANATAAGYAEVSPEGLKLIPNTKVDALYLREGVDFSGYDKFAMLECFVAFRANYQLDQNGTQSFRVTASDMLRIKKQLAQQFQNVFVQQLTAKGEKYVTAVGKGVLILRPSILNLDVAAPQTMNSGSNTLTFNAGQATLVLEIFDSVSSQLLARIIDTEVAGQSSIMISRNSMSNRADANALLKSWADRFATAWQNARAAGKNLAVPKS